MAKTKKKEKEKNRQKESEVEGRLTDISLSLQFKVNRKYNV